MKDNISSKKTSNTEHDQFEQYEMCSFKQHLLSGKAQKHFSLTMKDDDQFHHHLKYLSHWLKNLSDSYEDSPSFFAYFLTLSPLDKIQNFLTEFLNPGRALRDIKQAEVKIVLQILRSVLQISSHNSRLLRCLDEDKLKSVMANLFTLIIEKQHFKFFKTEFLLLCIKIFSIAPHIVHIDHLSLYLYDEMTIHYEYYTFMKNALAKIVKMPTHAFDLLQKGFIKRVQIDLKRKNWQDDLLSCFNIRGCLESLIFWYKQNSKQQIILRKFLVNESLIQISINFSLALQNFKVIEQILKFLVDDQYHKDYRMKIDRYQFILNKIVREFLRKSNCAFMSLDYSPLISDQNGFEEWWIKTELGSNRFRDFLDAYTNNNGGIRFVLGMIANFVFDFPNKKDMVIQFLNQVDFEANIRFSMDDQVIRRLLSSYYELIGSIQDKERIESYDQNEIARRVRHH